MPLDSGYRKLLDSQVADMKNTGRSRSAGSCTAAIFLKEFLTPASSSTTSTTAAAAAVDQGASPIGVGVEEFQFAHIDIAGVMHNSSPSPAYLAAGMTGRPTRSMISFVSDLAAAVHVKK